LVCLSARDGKPAVLNATFVGNCAILLLPRASKDPDPFLIWKHGRKTKSPNTDDAFSGGPQRGWASGEFAGCGP